MSEQRLEEGTVGTLVSQNSKGLEQNGFQQVSLEQRGASATVCDEW